MMDCRNYEFQNRYDIAGEPFTKKEWLLGVRIY